MVGECDRKGVTWSSNGQVLVVVDPSQHTGFFSALFDSTLGRNKGSKEMVKMPGNCLAGQDQ